MRRVAVLIVLVWLVGCAHEEPAPPPVPLAPEDLSTWSVPELVQPPAPEPPAAAPVVEHPTPAMVSVTYIVDAIPSAPVSDIAVLRRPRPALLIQVTVRPEIFTGLSSASTSCALSTTLSPAMGLNKLVVTRYRAGVGIGAFESLHASGRTSETANAAKRKALDGNSAWVDKWPPLRGGMRASSVS